MGKLHTVAGAMVLLAISAICLPGSAAGGQAGKQLQCNHTLAQYTEALARLESEAAQARKAAEQNPLYDSDVAYYVAVLADARTCVKTLSPVTTAAR